MSLSKKKRKYLMSHLGKNELEFLILHYADHLSYTYRTTNWPPNWPGVSYLTGDLALTDRDEKGNIYLLHTGIELMELIVKEALKQ